LPLAPKRGDPFWRNLVGQGLDQELALFRRRAGLQGPWGDHELKQTFRMTLGKGTLQFGECVQALLPARA